MKRKLIWIAPAAIVALAGFVALGAAIVQQLWNWLLPPLFGWREVTFWQALGLLALCRILFGGLGGHGGGRWRGRKRRDDFTPEERERFRAAVRRRCGLGPAEEAGDAGRPGNSQ